MNWLKYIKKAFEILGGESSLKNLYSTVFKLTKEAGEPIDRYTDYQAQIRKTIYLHSSICDIYDESKSDLFYAPKGKDNGYWAIQNETYKGLKKTLEFYFPV